MNDKQYATMLKGFADLATRMSEGFTGVDQRFKGQDRQFAGFEQQFAGLDQRFDQIDVAHQEILDTISSYIQDVELRWHKKWTNHDQRLARLEQ